jgi:hypothetical protein
MKVSAFLFMALFLTCLSSPGADEFVQLEGRYSPSIDIPDGQTVVLISVFSSSLNPVWVQFQKRSDYPATTLYFDRAPSYLPNVIPIPAERVNSLNPVIYNGPGILTVGEAGANFGFIITDTKKQETLPVPDGIPSSAVVIPSDAEGIIEIILESSTDLITWTRAQPGQYGSTNSNRFFRLRAVSK